MALGENAIFLLGLTTSLSLYFEYALRTVLHPLHPPGRLGMIFQAGLCSLPFLFAGAGMATDSDSFRITAALAISTFITPALMGERDEGLAHIGEIVVFRTPVVFAFAWIMRKLHISGSLWFPLLCLLAFKSMHSRKAFFLLNVQGEFDSGDPVKDDADQERIVRQCAPMMLRAYIAFFACALALWPVAEASRLEPKDWASGIEMLGSKVGIDGLIRSNPRASIVISILALMAIALIRLWIKRRKKNADEEKLAECEPEG